MDFLCFQKRSKWIVFSNILIIDSEQVLQKKFVLLFDVCMLMMFIRRTALAADPMELQALLVLGGLVVAGIAIVLLMGLFSNSGTSYEEAMVQQRKATSELLALAESKNKSKKNNKKAIKKVRFAILLELWLVIIKKK